MRRGAAALLVALFAPVFAQGTWAQVPHPASEAGDVPRGPGVLRGEVVHQQATPDERRGAGVEVLLYALPTTGSPGVRRGIADDAGNFRFEDISNDPETVYLVGARYRGVPFPGARVQFRPGQQEAQVKIRIGELSDDASALRVAELEMQLEWRGGAVHVTEAYRVENTGALVAFVEEERRADRALFSMSLPEGATELGSPFGLPLEGVAQDGDAIRFFGPIYPSAWGGPFSERQEISLRYQVPSPDRSFVLERALTADVGRVVIRGGAGFEEIEVSDATVESEDGQRAWVVAGPTRGERLRMHARFPEAQSDRNAMTRRETRVFLELDGAALTVREEHFFHITGDAPLLAPDEQALLAIAIPAGARDLRFSPEASSWGLDSENGLLRLRGPLPLGELQFDVAYQIARDAGAGLAYEFESAPALPLLSVFIADTGLLIETERLHRRRPVRAGTRMYSHWEGFRIEAGDPVRLVLRPLAARGAVPRAVISGTGAALAALVALFLLAPLGGDRAALTHESTDPLRTERNALYAALRDLDHDHETGKVSDTDFATLRAELRARVAALFEQEDAGTTPDSVTLPEITTCGGCRAPARPGDRFCSQCGSSLDTTA